MQPTETDDASLASADAPRRLRLEIVDALFTAKGIDGTTAQTRALRAALGLHKSHWFKIRSGEVMPSVNLAIDIAAFLGTTVEAIYGRAR